MKKGGAMPTMDKDWRAESDHRTLCDADEIRSDQGRLSRVAKHHKSLTARHARVGRLLTGRRRGH